MVDKPICPKCGEVHDRCSAHLKNGEHKGGPCGKWPIRGGTVCDSHGGNAPHVRALAKERVEVAKLRSVAATFGCAVEVDPHIALLKEVYRSAGIVEWIAARIGELDPSGVAAGAIKIVDDGAGKTLEVGGRPHPLIEMYRRERAHLVEVCRVAITCGVAKRQVELAEAQGALIAQLLSSFIDDPEVGIPPEHREAARANASRRLRALPAS